MTLPWVRLDTAMPDNPKILALIGVPNGRGAAFVWVCCLAYSGKHALGGFVGREAVSRVNGRAADMRLLVEHGLLDEVDGGWRIHDWDSYQLSTAEVIARRTRAQNAARARWNGKAYQ